MKRFLLIPIALSLAASCLPSDNGNGQGNNGQGKGGSSGPGGSGGEQTGNAGAGGSLTGNAGAGGAAGAAGAEGGAGGGAGGAAGAAGGAGGAGGAANPVCDSVKSFLDGFQYVLPCGVDQSYSVLVCQNTTPRCTYNNSEYLVQGTCNTDKKFTVAGTSSQSCTITLHVQGVVEPKHYNTHCMTFFGQATEGYAFGPANGGNPNGCYPQTSGNYNVYMMHVSDNATALTGTTLTGTRYFWNAINQNEAHFSYPINYTTPSITIKGGQTLWMLADDSNQSAIKNCDASLSKDAATAPPGVCAGITVPNITFAPGATLTQPYNGQFISLHVASAQ
jgi:hypothetical protein